jgi:DNA-binding NtrC family response regulator
MVDDDKNLLFIQGEILAEEGYDVLTAATGSEALMSLERQHVDLVILDLNLPDIGGDALLQKIKRLHPNVKVIIMTGHEDIDSYVETMRKGATDYLIKPLPPKSLINVLKKVLHESRSKDA